MVLKKPKHEPETINASLFSEDADPKVINEAIERQHHADYQCFMLLRELMDSHSAEIESFANSTEFDDEDTLYKRIQDTLTERHQANHNFCQAVSGRG